MTDVGLGIIAIVALFAFLLILGFVFAARYKKVGPNQVLVISGRRSSYADPTTGERGRRSFRIVRGGGAFIVPVLERVDDLSLELITIEVVTQNVYTVQGVPVTVDGVAQVKVASDDVSIVTAAEQFLSKSREEIKNVALQTLEGHLRAILGTLTVEEIYKDRDKFAQTVQEVSAQDMRNMGLSIVSFTIKNIHDDEGYLDALGKARTAEVKRDAEIGQANASRDAAIQSAQARQEGEIATILAEAKIAEAEKDLNVKRAGFEAEVNKQKAAADLAYTLEQNIVNQKVKEQEVEVAVIEKRKLIQVQEQEAKRKERELEATVKKPAEAEQYRIKTLADAHKYELEVEAEGQSSATRNIGKGEADANRARGLADVDVVKARGLTEAEVIKAQGLSEAEAMEQKALAWEQYTQAAILQLLIQNLPELAAAIAKPLAQTEKIVVINNDGANGGGTGATRVTQDVSNLLTQMPAVVDALTGVDLVEALKNLPALKGLRAGKGDGAQQVVEPEPEDSAEKSTQADTPEVQLEEGPAERES